MKNSVEIITFIKFDAPIRELLKDFSHVKYVEDRNSLIDIANNLNYMDSHILIIDSDYISSENNTIDNCVRENLMFRGFSILLYSDTIIPKEMKINSYNLDFKGIIDSETNNKKELLRHVLNLSNLHAATFRNNSIRGMLEFYNLDKDAKKATYLIEYIVYKYNLSHKDASDIYLVLSSLIIAFNIDKITKVDKLLNTIFKSKSINKLYQNYMYPKSINGKYIAIVLKLIDQPNIDKYISTINMKNVDEVLFDELEEAYKKKIIYVSSLQDINSFWEQISNVAIEKYPWDSDASVDDFLSSVYELLYQSLLRVDFMRASIAFSDSGEISVYIDQFEDKNDNLKNYIKSHSLYLNSLVLNENEVVMTLEHPDKVLIRSAPVENTQDKTKISAIEFLEEYSLDQDVLDDLAENEADMNSLLFLEEHITQKTIENVYLIFDKYANILHETVEFETLADSLSSLSQVLKETPLDSIEESKKETLRFYIQGLVNDLKSWKQYIFIEPNTPDIHYMDDSLVENCLTIETFISSKQGEENDTEDEDDLEFF